MNGFQSIDYLDQLSLVDQIKLRRLLILELTALLDRCGGYRCEKLMNKCKNMQKMLNKINNRKSAQFKDLLFGVSLDELLQRDNERLDWPKCQKVPVILKFVSLFAFNLSKNFFKRAKIIRFTF